MTTADRENKYLELCLESIEQATVTDALEVQSVHVLDDNTGDLASLWNEAYRRWMNIGSEHMILCNDDILFGRASLHPLVAAFDHDQVGISGPMTNQPGHQPGQLAPIQNPVEFLQRARTRTWRRQGSMVEYVNGFCMCFHRDRLVPFDEDHLFDPKYKIWGGEDEYQKRMKMAGYIAIAMHDAWVYHFKGVSLGGGPQIIGVAPRLPEDENGVFWSEETGEQHGGDVSGRAPFGGAEEEGRENGKREGEGEEVQETEV